MKRTLGLLSSLSFAMLWAAAAQAKDLPNYIAPSAQIGGGAARFEWGAAPAAPLPAGATPAQAAIAHVSARAAHDGLSPAALASARVAHVHDTGRGGILVTLRQEIGGVPVFHDDVKVLLRRDLSLVALSGGLHPLAVDTPKAAGRFSLSYAAAVAQALSDLHAMSLPASMLAPSQRSAADKGEYHRFDLAAPGQGPLAAVRFARPARAKKVYFEKGRALVPAYYVEVFTTEKGSRSAYGYVVAAADGELLSRQNLRSDAAFKYRVWADTSGDYRPMDGPVQDYTPYPKGAPDGSSPAFVPPVLVSIEGLNKTGDPWLPSDATQTTGNNVDAYTDHDDSNDATGADDVHATLTAPGELDRVYDTGKPPLDSADQEMAAVTQLFYTTNWLHDYWYDSGFDEAAGNAQKDNYGRGGSAGDPLLAEAQDAFDKGASNNANMETPADGESPRMQMYVWDGKESRSITLQPGNKTLQTGSADFGPANFNKSADIVLVNDGTAPVTDACEPIVNDVTGKIALLDRGMCTFQSKAATAEAAGAVGVILVNNVAGNPPSMPGDGGMMVNIPVLSISKADGTALKTALMTGTVSATLARTAGVPVDGTIDNLIVSHEWGHYLHHRLVNCGLNQCGGESEGWGDFVALTTQLRPGDDLDGAFSDSTYAANAIDNYGYFGVRRFPYSTDMTKNPLTFQHIQQSATIPSNVPIANVFPDPSEVHNTGEVWTSMLFEGLVSLLKQSQGASPKYSFEEGRRRMADYVVAGLKLAPIEPTFTQQRDAIIAAALAADKDDAMLIAQGFAKRGAGSCAVSPPNDSTTNEGVVESFVVAPAIAITSVTIDDSAASCDHDGVVDAHETGKVTVKIANRSFLAAPETTVKITSKAQGVTFPSGAEAKVPTLEGLADTTLSFDIAVDPGQSMPQVIDVTITADNPAACNPTVIEKRVVRTNYDNEKEASTSDDFESAFDVWKRSGTDAETIWNREADDTGNHVWHGLDYGAKSDTSLVSPKLAVSGSEGFVMTFKHRYTFESSPENPDDPQSPIVNWDGALIEISADDGATWEDISKYVDPGYTGKIGNLAENPLMDRNGYTAQNPSWPGMDTVSLDFGKAFEGKSVQVRFRIGSDQAAGETGWEIDDVGFEGIGGAPFPSIVEDAQSCTAATDHAPIADAGMDQTVQAGATVTLDASKSSDPDGDSLSYSWSQAEGTGIALSADGAKATFTAPEVEKDTTFVFAVTVKAKELSSTDTVKVLVKSSGNPDGVLASGGGCGCAVPGQGEAPALPLGALGAAALGLMAYRRRRGPGR